MTTTSTHLSHLGHKKAEKHYAGVKARLDEHSRIYSKIHGQLTRLEKRLPTLLKAEAAARDHPIFNQHNTANAEKIAPTHFKTWDAIRKEVVKLLDKTLASLDAGKPVPEAEFEELIVRLDHAAMLGELAYRHYGARTPA